MNIQLETTEKTLACHTDGIHLLKISTKVLKHPVQNSLNKLVAHCLTHDRSKPAKEA